jgi:mRNA-degrading endonuclease toxin of MazEF toxin-antitoxin module
MIKYEKTELLYDNWNDLKKQIVFGETSQKLFRDGDIWWCAVGTNVGAEIDGKNMNFELSNVVLAQARSLSQDRLLRRMSKVTNRKLTEIKQQLHELTK